MNKRYLLLAGIIIALGVGILFMPAKDTAKQIQPELLLAAIDDQSRFLTTDDITDRLVKKDPALMLIDIRPAAQFNAFAIPGAINIPVDSLLSSSAQEMLNQKDITPKCWRKSKRAFSKNCGFRKKGIRVLTASRVATNVCTRIPGFTAFFFRLMPV